jgi:hypothetical protein
MNVTYTLGFFCGNFFCGSFFCEMRDRREIAALDAFSFLIIDSRGGWQLAPGKASSSASTCPRPLFPEPFRRSVELIETR